MSVTIRESFRKSWVSVFFYLILPFVGALFVLFSHTKLTTIQETTNQLQVSLEPLSTNSFSITQFTPHFSHLGIINITYLINSTKLSDNDVVPVRLEIYDSNNQLIYEKIYPLPANNQVKFPLGIDPKLIEKGKKYTFILSSNDLSHGIVAKYHPLSFTYHIPKRELITEYYSGTEIILTNLKRLPTFQLILLFSPIFGWSLLLLKLSSFRNRKKIHIYFALATLGMIAVSEVFNFSSHTHWFNLTLYYYSIFSIIYLLLETKNKSFRSVRKGKNAVELFVIVLAFVFLRFPFLSQSFAGYHTIKYSSVVEPALLMLESRDIFRNANYYNRNPVQDYDYSLKTFGNIPLYEWALSGAYYLGSVLNLPIELVTRSISTLFGVITLLVAYKSIELYFNKDVALLFTIIFGFNPIFNINSFIPVYDLLTLLIFCISFFFLIKARINQNPKILLLSAYSLGVMGAVKYSGLIWAFPIVFLLLVFLSSKKDTLLNLLFFGAGSFFMLIAFRVTVRHFPSHDLIYLIFFFLLMACSIVFYVFSPLIYSYLRNYLKSKRNLFSLIIISFSLIIFFIIKTKLYDYSNEFLTDRYLILNLNMYRYMLLEQFAQYNGPFAFLLFLSSIPVLIAFNGKSFFKILPFLSGSLFYWVVASKSIFFHDYYTLILSFTLALTLSLLMNSLLLSDLIKSKPLKILFSYLIFVIFILQSWQYLKPKYSLSQSDAPLVAAYLKSNLDNTEYFMDDSSLASLALMSGRKRVGEIDSLDKPQVKNIIDSMGFSQALNHLHIKYYVTTNSYLNLDPFANLLSDEPMLSTSYRRTDKILSLTNPNYEYQPDAAERKKIIQEKNLFRYFSLEKQIGSYKVFRLVE